MLDQLPPFWYKPMRSWFQFGVLYYQCTRTTLVHQNSFCFAFLLSMMLVQFGACQLCTLKQLFCRKKLTLCGDLELAAVCYFFSKTLSVRILLFQSLSHSYRAFLIRKNACSHFMSQIWGPCSPCLHSTIFQYLLGQGTHFRLSRCSFLEATERSGGEIPPLPLGRG